MAGDCDRDKMHLSIIRWVHGGRTCADQADLSVPLIACNMACMCLRPLCEYWNNIVTVIVSSLSRQRLFTTAPMFISGICAMVCRCLQLGQLQYAAGRVASFAPFCTC
jgi:hypothetical protein